MANGLPRRRHRTTSGSLRDSPEDDGPLELQEPARLRDRLVKKDRDREMRDRERDRDRERERDRLSRTKRRRGDKYMHGSNREDGGGGGDDSSEESVNDEDEEDDDGRGPLRYVTPSNHPIQMTSSSAASTLTTHRKSYPPPTKIFRQSVAPTWMAPDEMIGVSVPRKARTASTKRSQDNWGAGGGGVVVSGEQIHRQASASPVRSTMTASATVPSPSPAPMSPSSSNVSIKKKIPNGPTKQKPPKSCLKSSSSPPIQDDIEIEVAEVLYGLKRQSQAPSSLMQEITAVSNDSAKFDSNRSAGDSKSRVSSPISAPLQPSPAPPQNSSSSASPLTTVAPKRKRPRPYPDENPAGFGARSRPISPTPKMEADQALKVEAPTSEKNLVGSAMENGDVANSNDPTSDSTPPLTAADGAVQDAKPPVVMVANGTVADAKEDSGGKDGVVVMRAKVEEASSSPKMESQDQNRVESTSTSTKPKSAVVEKENRREDKFEIDLMASPSPEREGEGEYGGAAAAIMGDEKPMVTDGQTEAKPNGEEDEKGVKLNASEAEPETKAKAKAKPNAKPNAKPVASEPESQGEPHKEPPPCEQQQQQQLNLSCKERNIDLQLDLDKANRSAPTNEHKLDLQQQHQQLQKHPPPKIAKDEPAADKNGSSSVPLPMSVAAGWHGGLGPMGYVAPLHGVVSMDATSMASPPIQTPHFVFSPPKPKRCATHCYIARSVSLHQQMMKMNPYWPAAAAGTAPLFGAKPYNLNMVPPPPDLHTAAAVAGGRGGVANSAQDKAQPFALFPAQPSSKDKSPLSANAPDANAQKKQFLLPQSLPPGAASNMLHAPAFFFPFGQQQAAAAAAAAAAASARPSSTKSPSTVGSAVSTTTTSTSPISASSAAMAAGPAMSFSYPNMGGNETQFMAILGNGAYPFPVPAHVGAAPPYRGSHPQAMSFFNGSFYSSQMLHPSQLQQQQSVAPQSMQIQQQNHQNPSISTASSSSQKHLQQNQQQRPQGGAGTAGAGSSNPSWQNFPAAKGRPHHDTGGEDSPSTADSRTRPNLSVYGQNFAMPFHSPNFALMTPPSSMAGSGNNSTGGGPNGGGHSDKKQQQQQPPQQQGLKAGIESLAPAFPMSFASMNGATAPGLDISSMAQNHAILQSLPEAARHNYQIMAAAAQAAQAAHQKKNNYRGPEDGKSGGGSSADASNVEEERKAMSSRTSGASVGQSIAFSRDLAETAISTVPGGSVVDSSARSLNLIPGGSARPARSSGPNAGPNSSNASNSQQQQSQMVFTKGQQYVAATVAAARSKTPVSSNGTVYPDHLTSSVIAGKFPNALGSFPPLVQSGGTSVQSPPQWKNSVRPNTSQVSSPSLASATSTAPNNKNLPQQQGRPQQNHTQISFGAAATANPKPPSSQGQQTQNSHRAPSPPMMVGSPSTSSISKSAGGSPRTATSTSTSNKAGAQASTLSTQQGKNSQSPSLSSQKPSILGSPHIIQSSSAGGKPQLHESQQQPQLSKQSIHQAQLFFSSAYMHPSGNPSAGASAGSGYYLQRHRPENQQQQQGQKSQGSGTTPTSSSGMLSIGAPVSLANANTSDPAKAVAAAAAAANSMKGLPPQGIFHAAQFAQSAGGTHQLVPAGFSYVHAVPAAVQVKPAEQKQPAGE